VTLLPGVQMTLAQKISPIVGKAKLVTMSVTTPASIGVGGIFT
jgi:hypothetical protein